eukprot:TRINITY_DN10252_c1_g1_i1.p1 TRINITY_DN10252_c1_g1~~TRINITY_DN10252_c1_g1_i1.p1  ORF type:complete len:115 (+),score=18.97 TRINITY_DN10252_c1_g1_i1:213-557(+)
MGTLTECFSSIHMPCTCIITLPLNPALSTTCGGDRLLQPDPAERLGAKAGDLAVLKTHQWFAGFDWAGVARGEYFNQELRQVAHDKIQRAARVEGTLETGRKPYSGDQSHWERF